LLQEHVPPKSETETTESQHTNVLKSLWEAIIAPVGVVAYIPIIIVAILMFCGASWQMFWPHTDAARYQCYALTFWLGSEATKWLPHSQCYFIPASQMVPLPFHMLPIEYPPLTVAIFSLALLAPIVYYQFAFALWMALTAVFIYWLLLRFGPRGAALTFAFYALVGAWATAEGRFDMVPAAVTLLCIIAAERKHWTAAYIALAIAVLFKIYPILFFPALFIAEQRAAHHFIDPPATMTLRSIPAELWRTLRGFRQWQWKNSAIFFGMIIAITGLFAIMDLQNAISSQVGYFINRPIQIESTAANILWAASHLGFSAKMVYTFGSLNIISPLGPAVGLLFDIAFVVGCVYVVLQQWRGKMDMVQACIALLLLFIATGKVFSPQYLIWIMPLLAYACPLDWFLFPYWGLLSLLTTIIYPWLYTRQPDIILVSLVPGFTETVAVRDALFVFLTLAYLFNWFRVRERKPLPKAVIGNETERLYTKQA
jgi:hypothetical protein